MRKFHLNCTADDNALACFYSVCMYLFSVVLEFFDVELTSYYSFVRNKKTTVFIPLNRKKDDSQCQ